jgi:predicted alpha/beta hydrolase family esterase
LFKVARIGVDTVLLVHSEAALAALSWACHLSQRMRGQLHVLVLSADSMTGVQTRIAGQ